MLFTNSEHVGGQTHSIPMLLSFKAAILSGGFKLENTSIKLQHRNNMHTISIDIRYILQVLIQLLNNKQLNIQSQCQNIRLLSRKHFTSCNEHCRYFFE